MAVAPGSGPQKEQADRHETETLEMEESLRDELNAPQWVHGLTSCGQPCHRDNGRVNN
jgi:hypothetical protein